MVDEATLRLLYPEVEEPEFKYMDNFPESDRREFIQHVNCRSSFDPLTATIPQQSRPLSAPKPDTEDCPECDAKFREESPSAIEGDEGELYCSLECLNRRLNR